MSIVLCVVDHYDIHVIFGCVVSGVLVVNVTWRGKTYVGTLLDATKHDWAPPRYNNTPHRLDPSSQQTRNIHQMLGQWWARVVDGGPTLVQHLVDVSCLKGSQQAQNV